MITQSYSYEIWNTSSCFTVVCGWQYLQGGWSEGDGGQRAIRTAGATVCEGQESTWRSTDAAALSGQQEAVCHHLSLQLLGPTILSQPCEVSLILILPQMSEGGD